MIKRLKSNISSDQKNSSLPVPLQGGSRLGTSNNIDQPGSNRAKSYTMFISPGQNRSFDRVEVNLTAMSKIGFILAKMKKSLAQLALKPFLHNTFIQDTRTWILGELNCH